MVCDGGGYNADLHVTARFGTPMLAWALSDAASGCR